MTDRTDNNGYKEELLEKSGMYSTAEKIEEAAKSIQLSFREKLETLREKVLFSEHLKALYRYMLDGEVPWYKKSLVVAALIYFITPLDAIPDFAPVVGYLDDMGIVAAAVGYLGKEIRPYYDTE